LAEKNKTGFLGFDRKTSNAIIARSKHQQNKKK
jgi:hypothetical protein